MSTLETVNPADLTVSANVRTNLRLTDDLVKSIKVEGIKIPPVVYPDPDTAGLYRVLDGHRRHAAAIKLGLTEIEVVVVPQPKDDAARIIDQLVIDEHHERYTPVEIAGGFQTLALDFGLQPNIIANRTSTRMDRINAALAVARDKRVTAVVEEHPIDLALAAKLTEFADDETALAALTAIAEREPAQFDHVAQQHRDRIDIERQRVELTAAAKAEKLTLLDHHPHQYGSKALLLTQLLDKKTGEPVTLDEHRNCPGHAGYIGHENTWRGGDFGLHYLCTDPSANGHRDRNRIPAAPVSEAEKKKRKQDREDKVEWVSATIVRQGFIAETVIPNAAARPNADVLWLIAARHTGDLPNTSQTDGTHLEQTWLGVSDRQYPRHPRNRLAPLLAERPDLALTIALAATLARTEAALADVKYSKPWRDDTGRLAPYLERLVALGYTLSRVEQRAVDAHHKASAKKGAAA